MNSEKFFIKAKPVWAKGRTLEMNRSMSFFYSFLQNQIEGDLILNITGSTIYRIFFNGRFIGHGPARAAHGYYRVDEIKIPMEYVEKQNQVAIEIVGFNVNSYYLLDQPSFLQAELVSGKKVLTFTGLEDNCFVPSILEDRIQKVQKYSFQRTFIEAYLLDKDYTTWRRSGILPEREVELEVTEEKVLIERRIPYCEYAISPYKKVIASGIFTQDQMEQPIWEDRMIFDISPILKGFPSTELSIRVSVDMDRTKTISLVEDKEIKSLIENQFQIYDMGLNDTGFVGIKLECLQAAKICIVFDEVLTDEDIIYNRMGCVNILTYELEKGSYLLETIQPYTLRYAKIMVFHGEVRTQNLYIREFKNPDGGIGEFLCDDHVINEIFQAGRETFEQNVQDIYMDCPSRERAGWLCDSFFTGRVEAVLTGKTVVEDNFLENYLLPEKFQFLPGGMVPMCYPADHYDGNFIPNWALWFILELEEYQKRNPKENIVSQLRNRVEGILNYFIAYENEEGLLEDLEGWIFVEWSKANELVNGVNYPSNMLYSAALHSAGILYHREDLIEKSRAIAEVIRKQSFNGSFFADHSVRVDGKLVLADDITEVCQYYAFMFRIADRDNYPELFQSLIEQFGPNRDEKKIFPQVHIANAFIGNYLRVEMLSHYGLTQQIVDETKAFFDYMVKRTGTLWENTGAYASCNHGFASHVIYCYYRDLLGIWNIDRVNKKVTLRFTNQEIEKCSGKIPLESEWIEMKFTSDKDTIYYECSVPSDYSIEIINLSKKAIIRNF
jgi:alpha-L-rhamnosidase